MDLVFATNNKHKLEEVRAVVPNHINVVSLSDLNFESDIPEEQDTLHGNALQKAQFIYDKVEANCFADDTGLCVDALDGRPGVYSARYAGEDGNSAANIQKLLGELKDSDDRNAHFSTVIALVINDEVTYFEGRVDGEIDISCRGKEGFGYDPVFIPEGYDKTFAELPAEVKNTISHRARATRKLAEYLKDII